MRPQPLHRKSFTPRRRSILRQWQRFANWNVQKRLWSALFACIFLVLGPMQYSSVAREPIQEIRGVWLTNVDSEILFSQSGLKQGLDRVADLNLNRVYPTVWNWGYTLFPSETAHNTFGVRQRLVPEMQAKGQDEVLESNDSDKRDMLQELITLAKSRNISVMPWMEFGFMAPADSLLVQQHPDWVTQRQDGSQIKMEGSHARVWLNPFHPEVRQFLIDLTVEVVAKYDIDGIQYDDHLGLPIEFGYDPYTVELYQFQHDGIAPPDDSSDPEWMQWRADLITDWVEDLFVAMKAENPNVILSLSPNPAEWAYDTSLQDWVSWERRGFIEELVVQVYRDNMRRFRYELSRPELKAARDHIPVAIGILSGLRNRPTPIKLIQKQVKKSRDRHYAGVSFFFYESLWMPEKESLETRIATLDSLFE